VKQLTVIPSLGLDNSWAESAQTRWIRETTSFAAGVTMVGIILRSVYLRYTPVVIRNFRHKGLEEFFQSGSTVGIQPKHAMRLRLQPGRLDASDAPPAMALPGWRLTFSFSGPHAVDVDYHDYQ
jgi:proteic killer suppression protein